MQHTDKGGVERAGEPFDLGVYVTTLSISLAQGLEPLPTLPVSSPAQ